jgi:hypothetical protein
MSEPSVCIPQVFANITEARIRKVFELLKLGDIGRIDMILQRERESQEPPKFQRVFIHFTKWYTNSRAQEFQRKLIAGEEIKIIYDDPWFWKVSLNRSVPKTPFRQSKPPPKIEFTGVMIGDRRGRDERDSERSQKSDDVYISSFQDIDAPSGDGVEVSYTGAAQPPKVVKRSGR